MTDKEILEKAFSKAQTNLGSKNVKITVFNKSVISKNYYSDIFSHDFSKAFFGESHISCAICKGKYNEEIMRDEDKWKAQKDGEEFIDHVGCIYERDTNYHVLNPHSMIIKHGWQWHLQQMVLEKEPLKYLEKFLKD